MVTVRNARTGNTVPSVSLLIDSGADVTLLPREVIERLDVPVIDTTRLQGFDGALHPADVVVIDVLFSGKAFRGRCVVVDGPMGVMGRDILNELVLTLDGPRRSWLAKA